MEWKHNFVLSGVETKFRFGVSEMGSFGVLETESFGVLETESFGVLGRMMLVSWKWSSVSV